MFGGKAEYRAQWQAIVDTGILPTGLPANYKKKMIAFGLATKKRHGVYETTEGFKRC